MNKGKKQLKCAVCGREFNHIEVVQAELVRAPVLGLILRDYPGWEKEGGYICMEDLGRYRSAYVHDLLTSEKGDLSALEHEVLESMKAHDLLSTNVESEFEKDWTLGERLADRIATFGGSWIFLIVFAVFLVLWIGMNSLVLLWRPVDPYPFILLNLVLSSLAAVQAPVIMMSQNRQEAKDRLRSQHDYKVNLKAELEIRQLHEKMDHLLRHQWERLVQIQEVQIDMMTELRHQR